MKEQYKTEAWRAGEWLVEASRKRCLDTGIGEMLTVLGYVVRDAQGVYRSTDKGRQSIELVDPEYFREHLSGSKPSSHRLTYRGGCFVWRGGYRTKDAPKGAGFIWNAQERVWTTADPVVARKLYGYADFIARCEMGSPEVTDAIRGLEPIIHEALMILASVCDYAHDLDGQGYGKNDAKTGHYLAGLDSLTTNQAALGLRLVLLHRGQLPNWICTIVEPFRALSLRPDESPAGAV